MYQETLYPRCIGHQEIWMPRDDPKVEPGFDTRARGASPKTALVFVATAIVALAVTSSASMSPRDCSFTHWDVSVGEINGPELHNGLSVIDPVDHSDRIQDTIQWPSVELDELGIIEVQSQWLNDSLHLSLQIDSIPSDVYPPQDRSECALILMLYYVGIDGSYGDRVIGIEVEYEDLDPDRSTSGVWERICVRGSVPCNPAIYQAVHHWGLSWNVVLEPRKTKKTILSERCSAGLSHLQCSR